MPNHETETGLEKITGLTMRYAEFVAGLRYQDLPAEVAEKAKTIIRDGLGNQIAASADQRAGRADGRPREGWGGAPQVTITGYGVKVPAPTRCCATPCSVTALSSTTRTAPA